MMPEFFTEFKQGLLIGMFVGSFVGIMIAALLTAGKVDELQREIDCWRERWK